MKKSIVILKKRFHENFRSKTTRFQEIKWFKMFIASWWLKGLKMTGQEKQQRARKTGEKQQKHTEWRRWYMARGTGSEIEIWRPINWE